MAQNSGDLIRSLDNFTRKQMYIQAQPFVYAADKEKQLALLNERTAAGKKDREEWLAARAAETEITKAEREKINEQLKLIKAEREKEKLEKKQAAKQLKLLEKEQAAIEKEEKRVQAIEDMMVKREQQKDKAIEQAKKRAEQRAVAELKREQQAREREEKIRRSIIERAEKEKARKEIEELTKQVYEERRKELALEAEVKRREHEELEISARQEAEMKAAKARAEKEAYERGMREFRMATLRVEAERKLEEIAERTRLREEEMAKEAAITPPAVNPIKDMATAAWAASQAAQNPRLAAGHPNANPLLNTYVEDDGSQSSHHQKPAGPPKDSALSHHVNDTLLRLVQDAKTRLEVEKAQAAKNTPVIGQQHSLQSGSRRGPSQQGSVRPAHGRSQFKDSPLFALRDEVDDEDEVRGFNNEYANYLQEDSERTNSDDRSETSSIIHAALKHRAAQSKRNQRSETSVDSLRDGPAKRQKSTGQSQPSQPSSFQPPVQFPSGKLIEIDTPTVVKLLDYKDFVKQKNNSFVIRPNREGHTMYLTTMSSISSCDIVRLGDIVRVMHNQKLQDLDFSPAVGQLRAIGGRRALQSLAKKAHDEGYNAIVKIRLYEPAGTPSEEVAHCFVTGIPAVITSEGKNPILAPSKPVPQEGKQNPQHQPKVKLPGGKQKKGQQQERQPQNQQQQPSQPRDAERKGPPYFFEDFYH